MCEGDAAGYGTKTVYVILVYRAGQESAVHFRQWSNRSIHKIKTVDITSRSHS